MNSYFSKSINLWCYGRDVSHALPKVIPLVGSSLYCTNDCNIDYAQDGDAWIAIIGLCVDSRSKWVRGKISSHLCGLSLEDFAQAIQYLCGVYTIIRYYHDEMTVFSDATHMMPVYYGVGKDNTGAFSSCEALLVDDIRSISNDARRVLHGAVSARQMELVGDITLFDSVKCLLPNHYLKVQDAVAVRYFPTEDLVKAKAVDEIDEIIDLTVERARNVIKQLGDIKFASPLTPGTDTRVNCTLLQDTLPNCDVQYYTIQNNEMSSCDGNIPYCKKLAECLKLKNYNVLTETPTIDADTVSKMVLATGEIRPWRGVVWACHPAVANMTIVNGQILDHIAKVSAGEGRPESLAKMGIWIHIGNVSSRAYELYSAWYEQAKSSSHRYSLYDLSGWEFWCGRWNSNLISKNSLLGIRDFNFFNSAEIIANWCRIPRSKRAQRIIHRGILKRIKPEIEKMPFNPFIPASRHLPAWVNRTINKWMPGLVQEIGNYLLKILKGKKEV